MIMLCKLNLDSHTTYPVDFPTIIDLEEQIDPYSLCSLSDLSQRAFKVGMPYFAFAVANITTFKKQKECTEYRYYDAINYRLQQLNYSSPVDLGTQLPITHVDYFAIPNPSNETSVVKNIQESSANAMPIEAHPYPYATYFDILPFDPIEIERYAFSALNYHVLEEGNAKNIQLLKKIHSLIIKALDFKKVETTNTSSESFSFLTLERKKWTQINYNDS